MGEDEEEKYEGVDELFNFEDLMNTEQPSNGLVIRAVNKSKVCEQNSNIFSSLIIIQTFTNKL